MDSDSEMLVDQPARSALNVEASQSLAELTVRTPGVRWVLIALGVLTGTGVGLAVATGGGSPTHALSGVIALHSGVDLVVQGTSCSGTGVYDDMRDGAPVTVKNETGETIASGHLERGLSVKYAACTFTFTLKVPDAKLYTVEVSHRGSLTYSGRELAAKGWKLGLSLG